MIRSQAAAETPSPAADRTGQSSLRFLSFAFASADLLVELDEAREVAFSAGAAIDPRDGCERPLLHRSLEQWLTPRCLPIFVSALDDLRPGRRSGDLRLTLRAADGAIRRATARLLMLPDLAPRISCAIVFDGGVIEADTLQVPALLSPDAFAERVRAATDRDAHNPLSLSLVEIGGLTRACAGLDAAASAGVIAQVTEALQRASIDGQSAAQVSQERFAVLGGDDYDTEALNEQVRNIASRNGLPLRPTTVAADIPPDTDSLAGLRALRFSLNAFLKDGPPRSAEELSKTFDSVVRQTLDDASNFIRIVRERKFELNFQPVVDLKTGRPHHFEVLSRFRRDTSPAPLIRMAEEMELMQEFDEAVVELALARLRRGNPADLKLAINLSGQSLMSDAYIATLMGLTAAAPEERRRLTLEITESDALADPEQANRRIQHLREAGFQVAIDDFGAGAASYDYLHKLSVDAVKIDGRYIRNLESDERAQKMVRHLAELCGSLKLITVAEMVETRECAALVRQFGIDYAQGWAFGRPAPQPQFRAETPQPKALAS